jgi:hypothetical protein
MPIRKLKGARFMKKKLPKPENWIDFEDLCKRLWTEVWNYPETRKHGRSGNAQQGVDIYGKYLGRGGLIGIQCKGKDDYSKQQLSNAEIDEEINLAKQFKPALTKFYFATTANRSAKIELHIRHCNEQCLSDGQFEVHIFFWEDIVDLIFEHQSVYDFYMGANGFKNTTQAKISFEDGSDRQVLSPVFQQHETIFKSLEMLKFLDYTKIMSEMHKAPKPFGVIVPKAESFEGFVDFMNQKHLPHDYQNKLKDPQPVRFTVDYMARCKRIINHSVNVIRLSLQNTGGAVLEDFKVYFSFSHALEVERVNKRTGFFDDFSYSYNLWFTNEEDAEFQPQRNSLVQKDHILIDPVCFCTLPETREVTIKWRLVARDYENTGWLKIQLDPTFKFSQHINYVEVPSEHQENTIFLSELEFRNED